MAIILTGTNSDPKTTIEQIEFNINYVEAEENQYVGVEEEEEAVIEEVVEEKENINQGAPYFKDGLSSFYSFNLD